MNTYNNIDWQAEIDRHYGATPGLRALLLKHSRSVADLALSTAHRLHLPLDDAQIEAAAMLHDIGIITTDAPGIGCHGHEPYLRHGVMGASMLRAEGLPEWVARVAERHTGAGITADDVRTLHLPLDERDYMPETLLEKLICFADKYYSKSGDMERKSTERVRAGLLRVSPDAALRFDKLLSLFGDPDCSK